VAGKVRIVARFYSQIISYGDVAKLASQLGELFEKFRIVVRGRETIWLEPGFAQGIAPSHPVLSEPIAIGDSSLRLEPAPSERLAAVFFGGSLDFPKNVLLLHGRSPQSLVSELQPPISNPYS